MYLKKIENAEACIVHTHHPQHAVTEVWMIRLVAYCCWSSIALIDPENKKWLWESMEIEESLSPLPRTNLNVSSSSVFWQSYVKSREGICLRVAYY